MREVVRFEGLRKYFTTLIEQRFSLSKGSSGPLSAVSRSASENWEWIILRRVRGREFIAISISANSVSCSVPECSIASEKKTSESLYLTVEQVRLATSTWLTAQALPSAARKTLYHRAAGVITYHQKHNREARKYHRRTTLKRLQGKGINIKQLETCTPPDL